MRYLSYFITASLLIFISFIIYNKYIKSEKIINVKNNTIKEEDINDKKEYKIVAFGDSLTAGLNVDLKDSYPTILEQVLNKENLKLDGKEVNIKVINMGVSGETTTGGLERVDFIISQNPNLVLLGLGANDMLRATNPTITKNNLESIIKSINNKNIPIILLGMQSQVSNGFDYKKDFDAIYPNLSQKYNLPLVPFFLDGVALVSNLNTSDGIHPNRAGYEKIINENILPTLLPFLKNL